MLSFTLPKWTDLHMHARQGDALPAFLAAHAAMGCDGILAMPNTKPPVGRVFGPADDAFWSIESYRQMLLANGGQVFRHLIVPLYLTASTTPEMIIQGAASGLLKCCKSYPPGATTESHAAAPLGHYARNGVLAAMEETGTILNLHGEAHDLTDEEWIDQDSNAETLFYSKLGALLDLFPRLRVVCEHISTKEAAAFVKSRGDNVVATVCPQHLIYTHATLSRKVAVHLSCQPSVKWIADRKALRDAVTDVANRKFFAGTDSAPHFKGMKETPCGCASGCFTGGIAVQLYAHAFGLAGLGLETGDEQAIFQRFLCTNGPAFYGLSASQETFTLVKQPAEVVELVIPGGQKVVPLTLGLNYNPARGVYNPTFTEWKIAA